MIETFEHGWHDVCACGHPYGVHENETKCHADNAGTYKPSPDVTYRVCFCHAFIPEKAT